jgi:fructose-1,6-bisphosphatase/inositol monophosphatase family enzyme
MELTTSALSLIRSTRAMSLPRWGNVEVASTKNGSATDVVTEIDLAIEEYLATEFRRLDPGIGFVGEEHGGDRDKARHWLVDPIDGTAHYVRGIPLCTTMVALIEDGQVTFAAIYDFVNDVMYHALRGGGAFKNGKAIHVSDRPLSRAYMFYESNLRKGDNLQTYLAFKEQAQVLNLLNAGHEFALVASGKIEGRICLDPYGKDYDFAPGSLLVAEAGGVVANIGSAGFDYTDLNFIAANKSVYQALTSGEDALFPLRA